MLNYGETTLITELENKTNADDGKSRSNDLLSRIPCTRDGVPILWGDIVYFDDPDKIIFSSEDVMSGKVISISLGLDFDEYEGTHTILTDCLEMGNLECYSTRELVPLFE